MPTRTPTPHATYSAPLSNTPAGQPRAALEQQSDRAVLRLAAYTLLILFFELALIRYTAAYVRVFAFYSNFVLIAAFLGMGVGLLRADAVHRVKWLAVPVTLLLFGAVRYLSRVPIAVPQGPAEHLWAVFDGSASGGIPLLWVAVLLFGLCALFFVPLGALVGAEFRILPPLRAYSIDIAGSLGGILLFGAVSALRQPPVIWFAVGFGIWLVASLRDRRFAAAVGATAAAVLLAGLPRPGGPEYWSPYYRITVEHGAAGSNVFVNGSLHQVMLNFEDSVASRASFTREARAG
jgi:hypothetical protein